MANKIAVVILTNIDNDLSRVYRGLGTAREFADAGDDTVVVFDGSGVESLAAIAAEDHKLNGLLEALRDNVLGACSFCADSHGVAEEIVGAGFKRLDDNKGHASIRNLVVDGYQLITI